MLTAIIVSLACVALQGTDAAVDPAPAAAEAQSEAQGREQADADPALVRPADAPLPVAYHLGSFASYRAARLGRDGSLNSGSAVLRLADGASGQPLPANQLQFGDMPDLIAAWRAPLGDARVDVKACALPLSRQGDERVKACVRLTITSRADGPQELKLAASLSPGGGDPLARPFPSLPFAAGGVWAHEGSYVTRDGQAVLAWAGLEPQFTLATPGEPGAEAARLTWTFDLQPGSPRLLELYLLGPPANAVVDEAAIRDGATRWGYLHAEEQLGWQSRERGAFADIRLHDSRLWYALVGSLHTLRLMGKAYEQVEGFSDRPFGHPASDAAVDAEAIAVFAEWSFGDWASGFHKRVLAEVLERGQPLPPERRVALLHGLSRSVRLGVDRDDQQALAGAIRALLGPEAEGAQVRPWQDPDVVRRDLAAVLDDAGLGADFSLPHFAWAEVPPGSRAAALQAARRAISAHQGNAAWAQLAPLVAGTSGIGQGSLQPGGVPDFEFAVALPSLLREVLIDDHGDELHLFPAMGLGMLPRRGVVQTTILPTRYGPARIEQFEVTRKLLGMTVWCRGARVPSALLMHVVDGLQAAAPAGPLGGTVSLRDDGALECWIDPKFPKGLRFNVKLVAER